MTTTAIRIEGIDELLRRLGVLKEVAVTAAMAENLSLGRDIMAGSQSRAPILTGALIDSHTVTEEREGRSHQSVIVAAGPANFAAGPANFADGSDYSLAMHEGFISHAGTPCFPYKLGTLSAEMSNGPAHFGTGRGWKFLQRAFEESIGLNGSKALKRMAEAVQTAIKGIAP